MQFIHLSDLHLGKKVNGFSMLPDQEYIIEEILKMVKEQKPDGVIVAGDIYDKSVPPQEAVMLFDHFLTELCGMSTPVFLISGNHDSPERIAFGHEIMAESKVYISPVFIGNIEPIVLKDEYGLVNVYLLPFVKPAHVKRYYEYAEIESYHDAMKVVLDHLHIDTSQRNVLVAHQFMVGAVRSESEEVSVGGLDEIDASLFDDFDYVALGHLHRPQQVGRETVRYCGTPLKYSFSEASHRKCITQVILQDKGMVKVNTLSLTPLRDMRELKGTNDELTLRSNYERTNQDDYIHITLTDEEDVLDAVSKLRTIYPKLMKLDYDNTRTRNDQQLEEEEQVRAQSPKEILTGFYEAQNGQPMNEKQQEYVNQLIQQIWEV